jgi:2,4-dienoyl-CoA reductase (NADPH2)
LNQHLIFDQVGDAILRDGDADMVSMARFVSFSFQDNFCRPFLADPYFVLKAQQDRADEINTCIGCNQVGIQFPNNSLLLLGLS